MKNKLKYSLLLASFLGATVALNANFVKILTPEASTGYQGLSAANSSLTEDSAGSWTFQVGMFGTDPAGLDASEWRDNWTSFNSADWVVNPPFAAGKIEAQWSVPSGSSFTGNQGYIWGFNDQAYDVGSEWVLVTNESWVFPDNDPLALAPKPENTWNIAADSNVFLFGTQLDNGFQMQAIPEPSTYALIFGLGILGFLGYRRVRK